MPRWFAGAFACGLALAVVPAAAQTVALSGIMGERALLVIDDAPPAVFAPGETRQGVTLVSAAGDTATIEIAGQRQVLHVGERPVGSNAAPPANSAGSRIVLHAGSNGHFLGIAKFNGVTAPFMVDTGASDVVMGPEQAERVGINYREGSQGMVTTANGVALAYQVHLNSIRLGDVEVYNVEATIVPKETEVVLLGNSFLGRFQMHQENDQLVLEKRY